MCNRSYLEVDERLRAAGGVFFSLFATKQSVALLHLLGADEQEQATSSLCRLSPRCDAAILEPQTKSAYATYPYCCVVVKTLKLDHTTSGQLNLLIN